MLFNSIPFAIFLPVVFFLYWVVCRRNLKMQNIFIVAASYFFYGWWDWRFLLLLAFTSFCTWGSGFLMQFADNGRFKIPRISPKIILIGNLVLNLGILGFFKYYNFFVESFVAAFASIGFDLEIHTLRIILPVGISFYTFQALSYSIDVYYKRIEPTKNIVAFFAFVSFFPLLLAGPIERATRLLPQFYVKRTFDYAMAVDGIRQILWGLFKKIVIADTCALFANQVFDNYEFYPGSILIVGAICFALQIYGDFSGYSDIAIGVARLFGINLMRNFNFPYFSRDIAEFWRRWHISLTTWFRDYIYIPLGGSRVPKVKIIRNTFIIFLVSGLWHGANWTFIAWGAFHALVFLPLIIGGKNRKYTNVVATGKILPSLKELFQMGTTFGIVVIGWVFFRADNITQAWNYISEIFSPSLFHIWVPYIMNSEVRYLVFFIPVFLLIEWIGRNNQYGIEKFLLKQKSYIRYSFYLFLAICVICFSLIGQAQEFIYFQF